MMRSELSHTYTFKQTAKMMKEKGLPVLSIDEIEQAQWFNLNNLRLVYNLVEEVIAILNGKM